MEILANLKNYVDTLLHKIREAEQTTEDISEIIEHVEYNMEQLGREK